MNINNPNKLSSYFKLQKKNLFLITVTGIIYNIGMTAGPFFEGRLAQCLLDISNHESTWRDMLELAIIYIIIILFVQGNRALKRFFVRKFANETSKNMRHMLYNTLVHKEKEQLETEQLGAAMTKAVSDVDACVEGMRKFTTEVFDTGIVLIAYAVMLCMYDVRLAVMSYAFIPIAYLIAEKCKGVVTKYNEKYKKSAEHLNQSTMDLVGNEITYRVFGLEEERCIKYEKDLKSYQQTAVKANLWESALQPIYYVISMCGAVLIFYFGGKNVMGTGSVLWNVGIFTTFFSCFTKLAFKSSKAAKLFNAVQKARVSWKRIQPMLQETIDNERVKLDKPINRLQFSQVTISYPGHAPLLRDITFYANPGEIIGITGVVASGKSAIGKVLIQEAKYTGKIQLGEYPGYDFSQLSIPEQREYISYMGHEPELMSTSIRENILLQEDVGKMYHTDLALSECVQAVCLNEEIADMPDGINTLVGNGGLTLSGGQQSRVALARTLIHGRPVMVLDDPFSAVDKNTELTILQNIRLLNKNRITLLISHRIATFPSLDKVLFIHDHCGYFGTHDELMKTQKEYRDLFEMQAKGQEVSYE